MKKSWEHLKDVCYNKETGIKKGMTLSILMLFFGLGVMIWFLIRLLFCEGHWNTNHFINLPSAGLIGDFIGGLSGTLFALVGVLFLFETLSLQRNEFKESRKVFEKQQFDNTFFNLINVYQEVVKSLHFDSLGVTIGKAYFEEKRRKFYTEFEPFGNYTKNRRMAKIKYIEFYTASKEQTANYFRTIYRIFRFINNSNISPLEKMDYAKIFRAQLSESELFFLYHNSFSEYGTKFRQLINDYHILKHLPTLEKVEFKRYAIHLEQIQKNSVGLVLEDLNSAIKLTLKNQKRKHKSYLMGAFDISVESENSSHFMVTIIKRDNYSFNNTYQQGFGMSVFDIVTTCEFFSDYLSDMLSYSNYLEFNRGISITPTVYSSIDKVKHTAILSVRNLNLKSIKIQ